MDVQFSQFLTDGWPVNHSFQNILKSEISCPLKRFFFFFFKVKNDIVIFYCVILNIPHLNLLTALLDWKIQTKKKLDWRISIEIKKYSENLHDWKFTPKCGKDTMFKFWKSDVVMHISKTIFRFFLWDGFSLVFYDIKTI